jgi:hypothetical protein
MRGGYTSCMEVALLFKMLHCLLCRKAKVLASSNSTLDTPQTTTYRFPMQIHVVCPSANSVLLAGHSSLAVGSGCAMAKGRRMPPSPAGCRPLPRRAGRRAQHWGPAAPCSARHHSAARPPGRRPAPAVGRRPGARRRARRARRLGWPLAELPWRAGHLCRGWGVRRGRWALGAGRWALGAAGQGREGPCPPAHPCVSRARAVVAPHCGAHPAPMPAGGAGAPAQARRDHRGRRPGGRRRGAALRGGVLPLQGTACAGAQRAALEAARLVTLGGGLLAAGGGGLRTGGGLARGLAAGGGFGVSKDAAFRTDVLQSAPNLRPGAGLWSEVLRVRPRGPGLLVPPGGRALELARLVWNQAAAVLGVAVERRGGSTAAALSH